MSYQPLPSSDDPSNQNHQFPPTASSTSLDHSDDPSDRPLRASVQREFNRPPPATWKRILIVIAIIGLGWLSIKLGKWGGGNEGPEIIYASRYSEEFKYRPAASPVITEYLKDGRIRLRGASIGGVGVREEDVPKTPFQKQEEEKKRIEEARKVARKKMGLKPLKKGKKMKSGSGSGKGKKDEI